MIDEVRPEPPRRLDRLGNCPGFGDDIEVRPPAEQRYQALPDDLVIVDDQEVQSAS